MFTAVSQFLVPLLAEGWQLASFHQSFWCSFHHRHTCEAFVFLLVNIESELVHMTTIFFLFFNFDFFEKISFIDLWFIQSFSCFYFQFAEDGSPKPRTKPKNGQFTQAVGYRGQKCTVQEKVGCCCWCYFKAELKHLGDKTIQVMLSQSQSLKHFHCLSSKKLSSYPSWAYM